MHTVVFHLRFSFQTKACVPPPSHTFLGIWYFYTMLWISELQKVWQFSQWVFCHSTYRDNTGNHNTKALHFNLLI